GVSDQPESSTSADFRASADSRSAMIASRFRRLYPNTEGCIRIPAKTDRIGRRALTMTQM
ncbi:hypothetical protein, partial [Escherichia coli]|uniref:hypothetical protein n=1 Tax=Escherichia coli TaxID=562 RepID=UPI00210784ED